MDARLKLLVVFSIGAFTASPGAATDIVKSRPYTAALNVYSQQKNSYNLKDSYPKQSRVEKIESKDNNHKIIRSFVAKKIQVYFNNHLENLSTLGLSDLVGATITEDKLMELNISLTKHYIKQDYLIPEISIDNNAMNASALIIKVKPATISNVIIIGEGKDNKLMQEYAEKLKLQTPARKSTTQRILGLMNKIPGYEISYDLVPVTSSSAQENIEVDLIILSSKKKGSIFAGADNLSSNDLGKYQFSLLGEKYTPFTDSDSLVIHGATTNYPERLNDIGVGYNHILNTYGTKADVMVSHAEDNATLKNSVKTPNTKNNGIKTSLIQQLFLNPSNDLEMEIGTHHHTSTQYKVNDNNASQKYIVSKYTTGEMGFRYLFKDKLAGSNLVNTTFTHGLKGTNKNYLDTTPLPKDHFNKYNFSYQREQIITENYSVFAHVMASYSKDIMPDSEQAVLGGPVFGRGYDFATLEGRRMTAGSIELRYSKMIEESYLSKLQPYLFADYGNVNREKADTNVSHLESYGAGLRLKFIKNIDLSMEVAQPCKKKFRVDGSDIKADTKFNVFINKVIEF
ncbi:MAG: ShlB/FhaC/HecB family hemolysin secretion/activation protein [Rickettsiales bacterium]